MELYALMNSRRSTFSTHPYLHTRTNTRGGGSRYNCASALRLNPKP